MEDASSAAAQLPATRDRIWAAVLRWVEDGWIPDWTIRLAVRRLAAGRLREQKAAFAPDALAAELSAGPIAVRPEKANEQHYELPADFFRLVLGPRLKYSACLWLDGVGTMAEAEDAMLQLTCTRARIRDGMRILDLGCGWGSLSFWIAEHFPNAKIVAVSNSIGQRQHIERECAKRRIDSIDVMTADINDFRPVGRFDRVVSVEMFEHVRNHTRLLERIADWLHEDGKLFVHIFAHRDYAYTYEAEGGGNWMARWFFTGGMMPSANWLTRFSTHMVTEHHWRMCGTHYEKTLNAWLAILDARRDEVWPILERTYDAENASLWFQRWRLFLLGSAATFGYAGGSEWSVHHYLMRHRNFAENEGTKNHVQIDA